MSQRKCQPTCLPPLGLAFLRNLPPGLTLQSPGMHTLSHAAQTLSQGCHSSTKTEAKFSLAQTSAREGTDQTTPKNHPPASRQACNESCPAFLVHIISCVFFFPSQALFVLITCPTRIIIPLKDSLNLQANQGMPWKRQRQTLLDGCTFELLSPNPALPSGKHIARVGGVSMKPSLFLLYVRSSLRYAASLPRPQNRRRDRQGRRKNTPLKCRRGRFT